MLKDCIVTMNINGIPQSFTLRGISGDIDDNIQEQLFNEIKNQTFSNTPYGLLAKDIFDFYNKTLLKDEIIGAEISENDSEVLPEDNTTNSSQIEKDEKFYKLDEFINENSSIKSAIDLIKNETQYTRSFGPTRDVSIKLTPTNSNQRSFFDYKINEISIYYDPDLKTKDYFIKRQFLHEYVHYRFSEDLSLTSFLTDKGKNLIKELIEVIKNTKKGNKKIFKDFDENKSELYQANEYLAEYYTGLALKELDRNEAVNKLATDLIKNNLPFYTELVKNDFISNEDEISTIIRKFKNPKGNFFEKETQEVLKRVFDSKQINTENYNVEDTYNRRIQREDETDFNFNLGLSKLTTFDLIKVPWESKDKKGEKWMPIIYQYFDKQKNQRIYKVADQLKGGENKGKYVYQDIADDDILAYSQNIGLIDNSNIKKPNLKKIRESFEDSISFNESDSIEGGNPGILNINTKKGKNSINKEFMYLPINSESDLSIDNVLRTVSQGDIVKYKIKNKNLHGPIYRVLANTVEIVNKEGNLFTIPFRNIAAVIVKKSKFLDDLNLDSETISDEFEDLNYDNKGLAFSNFLFTDKFGSFKKLKNQPLYDYNQIFNNNTESKKDEFNRFIAHISSKKNKDESIESYIKNNLRKLNPEMVKYYEIYNNRSKLINSISNANTYVSYDYIGNDGNKYSGKGKVVAITHDTIKVFTPKKDGSEGFIQTLNIRDNIATKNNPAIRRVIFDNQQSYQLAQFFNSQKQIIQHGYNSIIDKNKSIGDRKAAFKNFISNNKLDDILDMANTDGLPTNLSDFYYYDYLNSELMEELSELEKDKYIVNAISKLTPGCIVFQKTAFGNIPAIVTDIDKNGDIYTGDIITAEGKYNGNYVRKKLDPYKLTALGYNIKEIGDIKPNEYYKAVLKGVFKNLSDSRTPKVFNSKESAERWLQYNKGAEISELFRLRNKENNQIKLVPKMTYDKYSVETKNKYDKVPFNGNLTKYTIMLNFDGEFSSVKNINAYNYRFNKDDSKHDKAFNLMEIGDLVTYKGSGYDMPITLVITNKLKSKNGSYKYKAESFSENGTKILQMVLSPYNYDKISYIKYQNTRSRRMEENQDIFTGISQNYIEKNKYKPRRFSKPMDDYNKSYDSFVKVKAFSNALENKLGIKFTILDSNEISMIYDDENNRFSDKRAFVYDGEIVLNSDLASLAEPLHELTHVILGEMKINNPGEYKSIINNVASHPDFDKIAKHYPELSGLDLNEEVFSTIFGEYYGSKVRSNESQDWNRKNKSWFNRVMDKIKSFFGKLFNIDVKNFDLNDNIFINMSINEVMDNFGGKIMNNEYDNYINDYKDRFNENISNILNKLNRDKSIKEECYE